MSILVDEIVRTSGIFYKIADNIEACCRPTGSIRLIYVSRASLFLAPALTKKENHLMLSKIKK